MDFFVPNKRIACTPLGKYRNIQMQGTGFKTVVQKGELLELTVIFGNGDYQSGDRVYVKGGVMTLDWAKAEFTVPSKPATAFILIPEEYIELRVRGNY